MIPQRHQGQNAHTYTLNASAGLKGRGRFIGMGLAQIFASKDYAKTQENSLEIDRL